MITLLPAPVKPVFGFFLEIALVTILSFPPKGIRVADVRL
jgi:hypothetical protein